MQISDYIQILSILIVLIGMALRLEARLTKLEEKISSISLQTKGQIYAILKPLELRLDEIEKDIVALKKDVDILKEKEK